MLRVTEHATRTDTGLRRSGNEDAHYVRAPLFVLADGMGGAQAGEVASRTAIEVLARGLPDGPGSEEERLAALVSEANSAVHALAVSDEQLAGMGTTLTAAYLGERELAVAHVGDSRLYLLRDGKLRQLTDDHSLVGELVRRGELSAQEAEGHPQRSIITRALGPEDQVVVDHLTWPAQGGDVYLLCSDGLTDMVDDQRIEAIITDSESLSQAASALVAAANEAGGRDNITVILFRVEEIDAPEVDEQPTMVGSTAPRVEDVRAAAAAQAAQAPAQTATVPNPAQEGPVQRRIPRPPRAGTPVTARPRRSWTGPAKLVIALLAVVAIIGSAGWIASRSVYFVGVDESGFVALYQGVPYELPGLPLYTPQYVSGLPTRSLSPRARRLVTEHKLRSQQDAVDLVRQLERGDVVGQ
jgi:protein phosphatase